MRKLLLLMLLLLAASGIYSQDRNPWNPVRTYCEIVGTGNLAGTKIKIKIDFGQAKTSRTGRTDRFLVDKSGKKIMFNSMVDALNYMAQLGWRFEQAYVVTEVSNVAPQNIYHYLLSKELTAGESIDSGIYTRSDYKEEQKANKEKLKKEEEEQDQGNDDLYN